MVWFSLRGSKPRRALNSERECVWLPPEFKPGVESIFFFFFLSQKDGRRYTDYKTSAEEASGGC